jgi:murein DD-endopeptidase MepM/ murein hydrolase activator NlpD
VSYVMFAVAILLALLKLGGITGAKPLFLKMVPAEPVAKAAEPADDEKVSVGERLDLPDADGSTGRLLAVFTAGSGREEGETPVFRRPSSGDPDSEPVCGNLGNFPKSSRVVFPLPEEYFDSYEDTWGAARRQGGHEGTDLMSPTGIPEFAITDGTLVRVKGANDNGWNRLGGYTVMLEAAYDAGPIKKGDLFYYAHLDEESALPIGTKVRAGQQIGVVGDTGEGREVTRGKFPSHLHLGWYDMSGARTNLESGAMNPYPLLLWLEEHGGAISGGTDAAYCEAPQGPVPEPSTGEDSWPAPDSPGTRPDLDTGDDNDARPSPTIEEGRKGRFPEPNEEDQASERDERTRAGDGHEGNSTTGEDGPTASGKRASRPSTDDYLRMRMRVKIQSLLSARTSRPSYASALADALRKTEKKERDKRNTGTTDKKKQKKPPEPFKRKEPKEGRSAARSVPSQSVSDRKGAGGASASGEDPKESPRATESEERTPSVEKRAPAEGSGPSTEETR